MKHILLIYFTTISLALFAQTEKRIKVQKEVKVEKQDRNAESRSLDIRKEVSNGVEKTIYRLKIEDNGQQKVVEWNGEGEMPDEIKQALSESKDEDNSNAQRQEYYEIETNDNGVKKVVRWNGEGEMPQEIRDAMEGTDLEETYVIDNGQITSRSVTTSSSSNVKVSIGVRISSDMDGVVVQEVNDDSAASKAGIKSGDTILKVDGRYIFNDKSLFDQLGNYSPGDQIKVTILRDGKEKDLSMKLAAR